MVCICIACTVFTSCSPWFVVSSIVLGIGFKSFHVYHLVYWVVMVSGLWLVRHTHLHMHWRATSFTNTLCHSLFESSGLRVRECQQSSSVSYYRLSIKQSLPLDTLFINILRCTIWHSGKLFIYSRNLLCVIVPHVFCNSEWYLSVCIPPRLMFLLWCYIFIFLELILVSLYL